MLRQISTLLTLAGAALLFLSTARADINPATGEEEIGIEGQTLTGQPLRSPDWLATTRARLEQDLAIAKAVFAVAPDREDSWIWLGRRYGYLGYNEDAIAVFSAGIEHFPESYKLHRFRGRHRARSRDFEGAIQDYQTGLEKMEGVADTFEPDGLPNARRLTISTYRSNLHYYLGQTVFATGDYERMVGELDRSLESPIALDIDDHRVAVAFWKYIALRKLGRKQEAQAMLAAFPKDPVLIENETYFSALNVFRSDAAADHAAAEGDSLARFALGMRAQFDGQRDRAIQILTNIVSNNALGYWPAEVELVNASGN